MFNKTINKFSKNDDYMTQESTWKQIEAFIPKDKVIWEAFFGDGLSAQYLRSMGCKEVIHHDIDFFEYDFGEIVVSNPPFTLKKEILTRLKELNRPFILIMPLLVITSKYFRELFPSGEIQIIIPSKRIYFEKKVNGVREPPSRPSFDSIYYCWKMGFEHDINYV